MTVDTKGNVSRWRRLLPALVLVMWASEFVHLSLGFDWANHLAASMAALIAGAAFFSTRGTPRKTLLVCSVLVAFIVLYSGNWASVWTGVQRAALFACFLASLFSLSALVRLSSRLEGLQQTFDQQPQADRAGVLQVLGLIFAVPLAVGAVGIVAPLLSDRIQGEKRLADASWAMRGMGLAVLFSPFTVAMGVAIESSVASLPIGTLMLFGLALALGLVGVSFMRGHCAWPSQLTRRFLLDLALMLGPVLLLIAINLTLVFGVGFTPMQAAAVTLIPCVALIAVVRRHGALTKTAREVRHSWRYFDGEIAIFVASLCFASVVSSIAEVNQLVGAVAAYTGPTTLIILTAVLIVGFAMIGVHMVVTATLFVTVFSPLMQTDWQLVLLALASLLGWSFGTMVALGSLAYVAACKVLGVSTKQMAVGINLRFMALSLLFFSVLVLLWAGTGVLGW